MTSYEAKTTTGEPAQTVPADTEWHRISARDPRTGKMVGKFPCGPRDVIRMEYQLAGTRRGKEPAVFQTRWRRMPEADTTGANDHEFHVVREFNASPGTHFINARPTLKYLTLEVKAVDNPVTFDSRVVKVTTLRDGVEVEA